MKKISFPSLLALSGLALTLTTALASAQILEIDSRTAFTAATVADTNTTIDFESLSISGGAAYTPSLTLSGVTFAGASQYELDGGFGAGDGSQDLYGTSTVTLPSSVIAAGSDVLTNGYAGAILTGTVYDSKGNSQTFTTTLTGQTGAPSLTFLGFVDTYAGAYITSISYNAPTAPTTPPAGSLGGLEIDNFTSSTPSVPEPKATALLLLSAGLLALRYRAKLRG